MQPDKSLDLPPQFAGKRIISLRQTADLRGISLATLRRQIAAGKGPKVVQLSARRQGVRLEDALQTEDA